MVGRSATTFGALSRLSGVLLSGVLLWMPGLGQAKEDVLNAEGITIYGQRELPKVMYIVPWKKTKSAEIDMPMTESLVVDVLDPIDPDVFRRKIKYYELMNSQPK